MMTIPDITLSTERLTIRMPRESDFPAVEAFMKSDRTQFIGGKVPDQFAAWRAFLGNFGHWALRGYGFFTVDETATGQPVGRIGLVNHVMWPEPEIGWHMFDGHEGKGFALEAALRIRDWAWTDLGLGPLISQIHPDNTRSRRLAERMGVVLERETTLLGNACLLYRHPDPRSES